MTEINGYLLCEVPDGSSDFSISYELAPYCVWLHMKGRKFPMPIGNAILPAKKVEIIGLAKDLDADTWDTIFPDKDGGRFLDRNNLKLETTLVLKHNL